MTTATMFTPNATDLSTDAELYNVRNANSNVNSANNTNINNNVDDSSDSDVIEQTASDVIRLRKLQKKLRRQISLAIHDFNMIEEGDVVMVCVSGGKDSYTLLDILLLLKRVAPIHFDVVAVNLDQKQPGYPEDILPAYLNAQGIAHYILEKDTYSIVKSVVPEGKTYCSACSRLRRGSLYGFAEQIGATKIALGHHRDDMLATFFLNLFHGGSLKSMPPKLLSDDQKNILIRPLAYVEEKDIIEYARYKAFPIIPCNLCGSQTNLQRAIVNDMLREWDDAHPQRLASIFKAMQNVAPSQLADRELFDFETLSLNRDGSGSNNDNSSNNDNAADNGNNDSQDSIVRLFAGSNIQVGQTAVLADMGLPLAPKKQTFDPNFNNAKQQANNADSTTANKPQPQKIPTINPVI